MMSPIDIPTGPGKKLVEYDDPSAPIVTTSIWSPAMPSSSSWPLPVRSAAATVSIGTSIGSAVFAKPPSPEPSARYTQLWPLLVTTRSLSGSPLAGFTWLPVRFWAVSMVPPGVWNVSTGFGLVSDGSPGAPSGGPKEPSGLARLMEATPLS